MEKGKKACGEWKEGSFFFDLDIVGKENCEFVEERKDKVWLRDDDLATCDWLWLSVLRVS